MPVEFESLPRNFSQFPASWGPAPGDRYSAARASWVKARVRKHIVGKEEASARRGVDAEIRRVNVAMLESRGARWQLLIREREQAEKNGYIGYLD